MRQILNWLFNHFLFAGTMFFAAGADALSNLNGSGDAGVMDTTDGADIDLGDGGEGDAGADADLADETVDAGGTGAADQTAVRDAKAFGISADTVKALEPIKQANPAAYKTIRAQLFKGAQASRDLAQLSQDYPGGVKDVIALTRAMEEKMGGLENMDQFFEDQQYFSSLAKEWSERNPAFVAKLAGDDPEAFAALAPSFVDQWAKVDPQGYNRMYAGMVVEELKQSNIPQALFLMGSHLQNAIALADNPVAAKRFIEQAATIAQQMSKWTEDLGNVASTAPAARENGNNRQQPNSREMDIAARETRVFNQEMNSQYVPFRDKLIQDGINKLLTKNGKTTKLTEEQSTLLRERIMANLTAKMNAQPRFREKFNAFYARKDQKAIQRHLQSAVSAALAGQDGKAGLIQQVYNGLFRAGTLGGGSRSNGNGNGGTQTPGAGWVKVAKPPQATEISRTLTEAEGRKQGLSYEQMVMKNKYVLKDGKKVFHD